MSFSTPAPSPPAYAQQMRIYTPPSPTPSNLSSSSSSSTPSSPVPDFVRIGDDSSFQNVTDDDIVKWCCYRDDEFEEMDMDDE